MSNALTASQKQMQGVGTSSRTDMHQKFKRVGFWLPVIVLLVILGVTFKELGFRTMFGLEQKNTETRTQQTVVVPRQVAKPPAVATATQTCESRYAGMVNCEVVTFPSKSSYARTVQRKSTDTPRCIHVNPGGVLSSTPIPNGLEYTNNRNSTITVLIFEVPLDTIDPDGTKCG